MYQNFNKNEQSEVLNWNAGGQFNDIVGFNKMLYIQNITSTNYEVLLEILSTDFDLTCEKMFLESTIRKGVNSEDIKRELDGIRDEIDGLNQAIPKNRGSKTFLDDLKGEITVLRRKIWDLQGRLGVLYPFDSSKKLAPGEAVRDF